MSLISVPVVEDISVGRGLEGPSASIEGGRGGSLQEDGSLQVGCVLVGLEGRGRMSGDVSGVVDAPAV